MTVGATAWAQVPTTVAFSGSLSTSEGPVDGNITAVFRLFDAAQNGNIVWDETQGLSADGGVVLAQLGSAGTPLDASVFDGTPLWLEVEIGGEVLSPRSPIASVPYAIAADEASYAAEAGNANALGGTGPSGWQARVTGTCAAGNSIRAIGANGTVTCETDNDTTYGAGSGLSLSGSTFSIPTGGVTSTHIANGTITGVDIASGSFGTGLEKKSNNTIGLKAPTFHSQPPGTFTTVTNKLFCAIMSANEPAGCVTSPTPVSGSWNLTSVSGGNTCVWVCIPN